MRENERHPERNCGISSFDAGFLGVMRKASSREQPHQPDAAMCSQCLRQEVSVTMKTEGLMKTR